ncbi:MAG: methylaspartate mutase subunit E [Deltaproteobacteria bacterium]|nr:methylaspartate mutase subunit E [Deltaproteobacteria bacterium]
MNIQNKKLSDDEFQRERKEVLAQWTTGKDVDLEDAFAFHKSMPPQKNFAKKLSWAKETGAILIRTDSGVPALDEHIQYLKYLQDEGGTDLLGSMVDSFTRTSRFEAAERELQAGLKTGKWHLNGFPMVNHGVAAVRKLINALDLPVSIRGNAPDWRFILEIGLAGGHTCTSSSPMMSFWHYSRDLPVETSIRNHQYMFRLIGLYEEAGVPIVSAIAGGFTILCPFSVIFAGAILDALIAAEQGTKNITLSVQLQGHMIQDVAANIVLTRLGEEYLNRMGYTDVFVTGNAGPWSGQFPADPAEAFSVLCLGVVVGVLSKSQIATVKTIEEAITIPTKESNAASIRAGKKVIQLLKDQNLKLNPGTLDLEIKMLEAETRAIVDRALEMGNGDAAVGMVRAVEAGVLDNPFATTKYVAGRVMAVRDHEGAVRYLKHGNLPFTNEIISYNQEKIAQREKAQGRPVDYGSVVQDLFSISQGDLVAK